MNEAENVRQQRGLVIAATCKLTQKGDFWIVPSSSGQGKYYVRPEGDKPNCSCPDFQEGGHVCKHLRAVRIVIQRELFTDGTLRETKTVTITEAVERKTYRQAWPQYNAAQQNEKQHFQELLRDLCKGLAQPEAKRKRGEQPIPIEDAIFAAIFKVYSTVSGRRFMTDLRDSQAKGYLNRMPSYNSIYRVLESPAATPVLQSLIQATAAPLKSVETTFACDASGFSSSRFERWFDKKYGGMKSKRAWVKCHLMCGVKTNIVTAVEISDANDCPLLPGLLDTTRQTFNVQEVCADLGYSAEYNLSAIEGANATALVPFKSNAKGNSRGGLWARAFHYFQFNRDEFYARYHQRSNVESTFSMLKAKFGDSVRSRTDTAMANEVLAKIVCHNICCLIAAMYELGVTPEFAQAI